MRFRSKPVTFGTLETRCLAVVASLAAGLGCNNNQQSSTNVINTALRIDSSSFLGSLRCLGQGGGTVGSYMTTLTHLEAASMERPGDGIHSGRTQDLPSTPPVDCHIGATFEASASDPASSTGGAGSVPLGVVLAGEHYVARIAAFDVPACPATDPDGGASRCIQAVSTGTPEVADQDGVPVTPRWQARCGLDPANGVLAPGTESDAGVATKDAGTDDDDILYIGGSYRGDLRPVWTTAQSGAVVRLQGCTLLEEAD